MNAIDQILYRTVYDTQGYVLDASESVISLMGRDIKGLHYSEIIAGEAKEEFENAFKRTLNGEYIKITRYLKRKRGKDIWLLTQFAPIFEGDEIKEILVLNIDITEQK